MLKSMKSLVVSLPLLVSTLGATGCVVRETRPAHARVYASGSVAVGSQGYAYVQTLPPDPIYEVISPAPYYGWVWIDGYWHWNSFEWTWVPGHWEAPRDGYVYVTPDYYLDNGRYVYISGYWERRDRVPNYVVVHDHRDGRPSTAYPNRPGAVAPVNRRPHNSGGGAVAPVNPGYGGGAVAPVNPGRPGGGAQVPVNPGTPVTVPPSRPGYDRPDSPPVGRPPVVQQPQQPTQPTRPGYDRPDNPPVGRPPVTQPTQPGRPGYDRPTTPPVSRPPVGRPPGNSAEPGGSTATPTQPRVPQQQNPRPVKPPVTNQPQPRHNPAPTTTQPAPTRVKKTHVK